MLNEKVPLPVPPLRPASEIQDALVLADQSHGAGAVTDTETSFPAAGAETSRGLTE